MYRFSILLWCFAAMVSAAHAQSTLWNGYQGSSQVPLTFAPNSGTENSDLHYLGVGLSTGTPAQNMAISQANGNSWTVDTGSTGMVITADYLYKAFGIQASQLPQTTPGQITYTSSGLTYNGFVYPLNVGLYNSNGGTGTLGATSQVPILIATSMTNSSGQTTNFSCSTPSCTISSSALEQFGVGFGRSQGSSNLNPLLNLTAVANGNVQLMAPGYVVTKTAVMLGLTSAQLLNTAFASLLPMSSTTPTSIASPYAIAATKTNWQTPAMTMVINNAGANANGTYYGSLLVDTGISNMELSTGGNSWNTTASTPTLQVSLPGASSSPGQPVIYTLVYQGSCGSGAPLDACPPYPQGANLSPIYPSNSHDAPDTGISFVAPSNTNPAYPFINTGGNFLNYFNVVYDPVSGFVGYQVSQNAITTTNNPTVIQSLALQGPVIVPGGSIVAIPTFLFAEFPNGYTGADAPVTTVQLSSPGQVTMSGAISSALYCGTSSCAATGLEIAGGSFIFTNNNPYTGTTTIDPGATLALAGGGSIAASSGLAANGIFDISGTQTGATIASLIGSGSVKLGGQALTLANAAGTFSGALSDGGLNGGTGGSLVVAGGTQMLTGTNTYTGATTINQGAILALGNTGSIANSSGLTANGIFDISATSAGASIASLSGSGAVALGSQTLTLTNAAGAFSGAIGGAGGLVVKGGTQILTGTNSYAGGTLVSGGATLAIPSDAALGASPGGLTFDNGTLLALSSFATLRSIVIGSGGGTVNANGFTVSLNGSLVTNGPFTTLGSVMLGGNGQISGGTTSVNGDFTAPALFVTSTGTLRGVGRVHAPTSVSGRLAAGNSPGTLTFTAPVTLLPGSTTQFDIDGTGTGTGAGNYSRLIVTGAGNTLTAAGTLQPLLRGITGSATNSYTPPLGQGFNVVSAQGGVLGSYANLVQPTGLATGTRFDALYGPTTLSLVVTPASYGNLGLAGLPQTPSQAAIGGALDTARPTAGLAMTATQSAIYVPLYAQPGATIASTLDQLAPTIYGDGMMVGRDNWYLVANAINQEQQARRGARLGGDAQAATGPANSTIWVAGLGQFSNVSSKDAPGYSNSTGGVAAGIDVPLNAGLMLGAAFGYTSQNVTAKNAASLTGDMMQFELYGSARAGIFFVDAQAGGAFSEGNVSRPLSAYALRPQGSTGGSAAGGSIRAGAHVELAEWQLEPSLSISGVSLHQGSLTETLAGPVGMSVGSGSVSSLQSLLGARIERQFALGDGLIAVPSVQLGWLHEYLDTRGTTTASLIGAPGTQFAVQSAPIGHDAAVIGVRAELETGSRISLYAGYTGALSANSTAQTVTAGLHYRW